MGQIANRMTIEFICNIKDKIIHKKKNSIRNEYKQKRKQMSASEVQQKSISAAKIFLSSDIYKDAKHIMLYMPIGNETDTLLIKSSAVSDEKKIIFPVTNAVSGTITPIYATDKTKFEKGAFSVMEPKSFDVADMSKIDVIVIPGIAFDKRGNRIGFGKGCYDKFLKNASAIKVGYCYNWQLRKKILTDPNDIKMDYIITENGINKC